MLSQVGRPASNNAFLVRDRRSVPGGRAVFGRPRGRCAAQATSQGSLQLLNKQETADGSTLFEFGPPSAAKKEPQAQAKPAQASVPNKPAPQPAPISKPKPASPSPAPRAAPNKAVTGKQNYEALSTQELRDLCKDRQVKGWQGMKRRQQMIDALITNERWGVKGSN